MSGRLPDWVSGRRACAGFLTGWEEVIFQVADADDSEPLTASELLAEAIRTGEALLGDKG
jgi:hypothetical protein